MTLNPEQARRLADQLLADTGEEPSGQFDLTPLGSPAAGGRIGRYTVLRILGVGGMGEVYEARQEQPDRTVAVKVLRPEFVSAEALRRFELEAEILSRLHHPGIAQVYEAGQITTAAGRRPYFAMELIDGRPLLKYCDENKLNLRQRLELFARVCDAVQHAHTQGIVHRDLKPANILVDKGGQPRILDFGIARATGSDLQTTTLQTDVGKLLGTIAYMSPEQASGDSTQVDTRSDVYSLGVVLYELIAGRSLCNFAKVMIHEAVRVVREAPATPLGRFDRRYRGDIETIAQKALHKEKDQRYQTSAELAADVRRHLADEPIAARKPSVVYQLAKMALRHQFATAIVLALSVGLLATAVVAVYFAVAESASRELAEKAAVEAQEKAKQATIASSKYAAVDKFLREMLTSVDPNDPRFGRNVTVRQVIDSAVTRLNDGELRDQPDLEASVTHPDIAAILLNLGQILREQNKHDEAVEFVYRSVLIYVQLFKPGHMMIRRAVNTLTGIYIALKRYEDGLALIDARLGESADLPETDEYCTFLADQKAVLLNFSGRHAEAELIVRRQIELAGSSPDPFARRRDMIGLLGATLVREGNPAKLLEAEELLTEAFEAMRSDPKTPPNRLRSATERLVQLYEAKGDARKAAEFRAMLSPDPSAAPK